jgi:hypothetical protein
VEPFPHTQSQTKIPTTDDASATTNKRDEIIFQNIRAQGATGKGQTKGMGLPFPITQKSK